MATMQLSSSTSLAVRDPWALVPSLGNLDAYISAVNRLPMLTADEESTLARRLRDQQDLDAAGRLVLSHLRLVVSVEIGVIIADAVHGVFSKTALSNITSTRHKRQRKPFGAFSLGFVGFDALKRNANVEIVG